MNDPNVVVLNSHPIQYFAPLYRRMAATGAFRLTVWYASRHGLAGETDRQFGAGVRWDVPLLDGYAHAFLPNASPRPSVYGFWGLLNTNVVARLRQRPPGILIVHGWAYAVCWLAVLAGRALGHRVWLRAENPLRYEAAKQGWRAGARRAVLRYVLFPRIDRFLYIGRQNRAFYESLGVAAEKLVFTPYAVDNGRFRQQADAVGCRRALRQELGLPPDKTVLLFAGKYIAKKRPLDLLRAVQALNRPDVAVVLMGDGPLRSALERYVVANNMANVTLTGFVNQSRVGWYYAAADLFVLPSGAGETWGLATNEAMNAGLPVILSDQVGCADDLLVEGETGFGFEAGNVVDLTRALRQFLALPPGRVAQMRANARARVADYNYDVTITNLNRAVGHDYPANR